MEEIDQIPTIESRLEGPKLYERVEVSLDALYKPDTDIYDSLYQHLLAVMQENELKQAINAAFNERSARIENGIDPDETNIAMQDILLEEAKKYAYRVFHRKSDNTPLSYHEEATMTSANANLHIRGIETPAEDLGTYSEMMIHPGMIMESHLFPRQPDIVEGVDTTLIAVYENKPFVIKTFDGSVERIDIDQPEAGRIKEITAQEAIDLDLPTLRDIHKGVVEIHWIS